MKKRPPARAARASKRPTTATPAATGARRSRRPLLLACLVLVIAGGGAWAAWQHRAPALEPRLPSEAPPAAVEPRVAYETALKLQSAGRFRDSLPYFRMAIAGVADDFWELHYNYANALHDCVTAHRMVGGFDRLAVRSSDEAVAFDRLALQEYGRAQAIARDPRQRAEILQHKGNLLEYWGLAYEAYIAFRSGALLDPANKTVRDRADALLAKLGTSGASER